MDVALNLSLYNRDQVARILESTAVENVIDQRLSGYPRAEAIVHYLKEHPEHIVAESSGNIILYYMYKKYLHPKHIPTMRIEDVDTSKLWVIVDEGGYEYAARILQMPHNQCILKAQ